MQGPDTALKGNVLPGCREGTYMKQPKCEHMVSEISS